MPFKQGEVAPPPTSFREPAHNDTGGTIDIEQLMQSTPLPFAATPASAADGGLTTAQYAQLYLECQQHPEQAGAIYSSYGIVGDDARRRFDAHWGAKLENDSRVQLEFAQALRDANNS